MATTTPVLQLTEVRDSAIQKEEAMNQIARDLEGAVAAVLSKALADSLNTLSSTETLRYIVYHFTGTLTAARIVDISSASIKKLFLVRNATTGGFDISFRTPGGSSVTIPNGKEVWCRNDGTNMIRAGVDTGADIFGPSDAPYLTNGAVTKLTAEANIQSIGTTLEFISNAAGVTPLAAKAAASPTADVFQVKDSGGTVKMAVNSAFEIDAKTQKIKNVVDPAAAQDAATKNYVDTRVAGAFDSFSLGNLGTGTGTFFIVPASDVSGTTEIKWPLPACTMKEMRIVHRTAHTGVGSTITYTLRKNGVDTALSVQMAAGSTTGSDTGESISFAAGDQASIKLVIAGTLTAGAGNPALSTLYQVV